MWTDVECTLCAALNREDGTMDNVIVDHASSTPQLKSAAWRGETGDECHRIQDDIPGVVTRPNQELVSNESIATPSNVHSTVKISSRREADTTSHFHDVGGASHEEFA
ncbi:hypothetical protein BLNAU_7038 [Blattamonas nauphoetae]|uniref:Uncharacterized protein n=1 Tax=Blattamonas nauphoetae TaxID=2049346 RepID=A0ABQ9Y283_9EUKA|nr:hypothetical protein BLNAU_7038 [Blattamonas nauphoetae]